jgi:hypothetical protein
MTLKGKWKFSHNPDYHHDKNERLKRLKAKNLILDPPRKMFNAKDYEIQPFKETPKFIVQFEQGKIINW